MFRLLAVTLGNWGSLLRRGLEWKTSEPLEGNERFDTGVALGKIHAPRMHILPKMRRRLHNKSHQTKNTLIPPKAQLIDMTRV